MSTGTAIFVLGILYLALAHTGFREVLRGLAIAVGVAVLAAIWYGSDKPQTWFYDVDAHPAFLLRAGQVCPLDHHVWNRWCVK